MPAVLAATVNLRHLRYPRCHYYQVRVVRGDVFIQLRTADFTPIKNPRRGNGAG